MVVLGVLLVLAAAGTIAFVSVNSTSMSNQTYSAFGYSVDASHLEMFVTGAVVAAVLLLGISMISSGSKRAKVRRSKLRAARHEADDRVAKLEEEKRALQRKLEAEHTSDPDVKPVHPAADAQPVTDGRHAADGRHSTDGHPVADAQPASDRLVHRDTTRA